MVGSIVDAGDAGLSVGIGVGVCTGVTGTPTTAGMAVATAWIRGVQLRVGGQISLSNPSYVEQTLS
jgi:hypothetical protein